jgi:hypothetical protein
MGFKLRRDPYVDPPHDTHARRPAKFVRSPSALWARIHSIISAAETGDSVSSSSRISPTEVGDRPTFRLSSAPSSYVPPFNTAQNSH